MCALGHDAFPCYATVSYLERGSTLSIVAIERSTCCIYLHEIKSGEEPDYSCRALAWTSAGSAECIARSVNGERNGLRKLEHRAGIEPANTDFADQRVSHFATGAHPAAVGSSSCEESPPALKHVHCTNEKSHLARRAGGSLEFRFLCPESIAQFTPHTAGRNSSGRNRTEFELTVASKSYPLKSIQKVSLTAVLSALHIPVE
jgi:hypothetical protein